MKEIFEIDLFEQQCVIIKEVLQSKQLEKHLVAVGVDQSLSYSAFY